jgi:hypothetical protein
MLLRFPLNQVNPYLFYKQHLAMPAEGQRVADLIAQVGSPRGAPPATPYLSLWARLADFRAADLDAALYERRELLRVPAMHSRLHLVRSSAWPAYRACWRRSGRRISGTWPPGQTARPANGRETAPLPAPT